MKKFVLATVFVTSLLSGQPPTDSSIVQIQTSSKNAGLAASDAQYTALANSMVAWGLGLAAAITGLTLLVQPSSGDDSSNTTHSH